MAPSFFNKFFMPKKCILFKRWGDKGGWASCPSKKKEIWNVGGGRWEVGGGRWEVGGGMWEGQKKP
jgi:hypothetical protein